MTTASFSLSPPVRVLVFFGMRVLTAMGRPAEPRTAFLSGQVKDPNGHAISGALVTMRLKTGVVQRTAKSDDRGLFECGALPAGTYLITADAKGFAPFSQELVLAA